MMNEGVKAEIRALREISSSVTLSIEEF